MSELPFRLSRHLHDGLSEGHDGGFSAGLLAVSILPFLSFILVLALGNNPALERAVARPSEPPEKCRVLRLSCSAA